jgi:hypothetical protein
MLLFSHRLPKQGGYLEIDQSLVNLYNRRTLSFADAFIVISQPKLLVEWFPFNKKML